MFVRIKKFKFFFTTIVIFIIVLGSSAVFWQSYIINEINDRLSNNKFKIISAKISGNLFTSIKIEDVNVVHPSYGDMSIKRVLLNINFISSLIGSMTFDDIRVEYINGL